jgi:hypothetical protein
MVTVLDGHTTEDKRSVMTFCNQNDSMQMIFIKKCFLFTMRSVCKAVHNWVKKFSQGRSKFADDARPGAEVAETTMKRPLRCRVAHTGKAKGQSHQCWWRICGEMDVLFRFEYHMFTFYIHFLPIY